MDEEICWLEDQFLAAHTPELVSHSYTDITVKPAYRCRAHALHVKGKTCGLPTILLLHGAAGTAASFADSFQHLSKAFHIISLDLPGFGRTCDVSPCFVVGDKEEAMDFFTDYIAEFLRFFQVQQVVLLGHSFGGFVAARYAARFSASVSHLILVDAAGVLPTLGDYGAYWAFFFKKSVLNVGRVLRLPHLGCYWPAVLSHRQGWGDLVLAQFISLTWTKGWWNAPLVGELPKLGCHVKTIYGENDLIIPYAQGVLLKQLFGYPVTVIPKAGHSPFYGDTAEAASDAVTQWHASTTTTTTTTSTIAAQRPIRLQWEKYASSFFSSSAAARRALASDLVEALCLVLDHRVRP
jgi:hypothetical protein